MPLKKFIASHPVLRYRSILALWKLARVERWAARHPVLSRWVRMDLDVAPEDNQAVIIPVQQVIRVGENTVLPYQVLGPLLGAAGGHMLLGRCPCRNGEGCRSYPHDFGCLFLGESVKGVSPKIGIQTDAAGALAHLDQALEMGLVPMIVHASFDADLVSLPYDRVLAVCFCCDCCCTVRHHMRLGPSTFDDTIQRLPGLSVAIGESCTGCGDCRRACPAHAIDEQDAKSVIDQQRCKGCGLCAAICPEGAPQLRLDPAVDVVSQLLDRIRSRTEIGL